MQPAPCSTPRMRQLCAGACVSVPCRLTCVRTKFCVVVFPSSRGHVLRLAMLLLEISMPVSICSLVVLETRRIYHKPTAFEVREILCDLPHDPRFGRGCIWAPTACVSCRPCAAVVTMLAYAKFHDMVQW